MATTNPFESLGLQFLGKERQHMGTGPLGEIAKMLPVGLLGYGLYKSGAVDNLNDMFNPKKTITDKIAGAMAPEQIAATGVSPNQVGDRTVPSFLQIDESKKALDALSTQNLDPKIIPFQFQPPDAPARTIDTEVDDVIPMVVSADPFKTNTAQDMAALQVAQAPAPPPSNVGQDQMGKVPQSGGMDMGSIVKLLMAFA
jgi:hypothetical protein